MQRLTELKFSEETAVFITHYMSIRKGDLGRVKTPVQFFVVCGKSIKLDMHIQQ